MMFVNLMLMCLLLKTAIIFYSISIIYKPGGDKMSSVMNVGDQEYKFVKIGTQLWMAENLKITCFSNGDPIPLIVIDEDWKEAGKNEQPACCNYLNEIEYGHDYGLLYNWYAITDKRGLAPEGWHVPTDEEWQILVDYLGGEEVAGEKLKETGEDYWETPNIATNESGFNARAGGNRRSFDGYYSEGETGAYYWSLTENDEGYVWSRVLGYVQTAINRSDCTKAMGLSVRLVHD